MPSETHKSPNYLLKIIGLVFLSSVVACNFCTRKPGNSPSPTPEESLSPAATITQEMIQAATDASFSLLAKVLQGLKDGNEVDIEERDSGKRHRNRTALYAALELQRLDIIQILLENGAKVNVTDDDGETPLHTAVFLGDLKIVECLLRVNGIEKDVKNKTNKTPYQQAVLTKQVAEKKGKTASGQKYQAIMEALEKVGANRSL